MKRYMDNAPDPGFPNMIILKGFLIRLSSLLSSSFFIIDSLLLSYSGPFPYAPPSAARSTLTLVANALAPIK